MALPRQPVTTITPQAIDRDRQLAQLLFGQAQQTRPQGPGALIGGLAQALAGASRLDQAQTGEEQLRQQQRTQLETILAGLPGGAGSVGGVNLADVLFSPNPALQNVGGTLLQSQLETPEGFSLSPGGSRFDAQGNLIASAPFQPDTPSGFTLSGGQTRFGPNGEVLASLPVGAEEGGFTLTPGQTRFNQLGEEIASLAPEAGDDPKVANQLRDEFVAQTNEFVDVQNAFRKVQAAAVSDSGPGDIALLVGYMKIIDPGSVVREGEFATAETAGGVAENIRNIYNRLLEGERLTPELRQRFVQAANDQFQTYTSGYNQTAQTYTGLAQRFGLDPASVVFNRVVTDETELSPDEQTRLNTLRGLQGAP